MIHFFATHKILNISKLKAEKAVVDAPVLSLEKWIVTILPSTFSGKSFVLFVHDPTLACILVRGKSLKTTIPEFISRLRALLYRYKFTNEFISQELAKMDAYEIHATNDRSLLAKINQMKLQFKYLFSSVPSYDEIELEWHENQMFDDWHSGVKDGLRAPIDFWKEFMGNPKIKLTDYSSGYR